MFVVVLEDDAVGEVSLEGREHMAAECGVDCRCQRCGVELCWRPACSQLWVAASLASVSVVLLVSLWVAGCGVLTDWVNSLGGQFERLLTILEKSYVGQSKDQILFLWIIFNYSKINFFFYVLFCLLL